MGCRLETSVYDFHDSNALSEHNGYKQLFCKKGKCRCEDTCLEGSSPLAPLEAWERPGVGHNPRNVAEGAPKTFYRSLLASALATLRFGKMDRGASEGREKLSSLCNLSTELPKKGFETADLFPGFVKPDGPAMDLSNRLPPEFDIKSDLLSGRAEALAKTDRLVFRDSKAAKHTSCLYNWPSKQMIGNGENWGFAQPVKDCGLVSYMGLYGNLDSLMGTGPVTSCWGDPPQKWGPVYKWFFLGLKQSEPRRLAIPTFPHVSSRD